VAPTELYAFNSHLFAKARTRRGRSRHGLREGELSSDVTIQRFNDSARHLAHFKCPQKIHFVPELPKTATGKVRKYVLRGKPAISKQ